MDTDPGPGTVSLLDVYTQQVITAERVRMLCQQYPDHEGRLRVVERRQWQIPASSAVSAGALAGAIMAVIRALGHG